MPTSNAHPDEPQVDEMLPDYMPPSNGDVMEVSVTGWDDDDDLAGYEDADDAIEYDESAPGADDDMVQLQARTEQLAQAYEQREAGRVHRKVTASAAGAALAGGVPAILAAVDALNLPAELQPFVLAVAAVLGTFVAGYATPERKPVV